MRMKKFSKAEVNRAIKIFKEKIDYLDTNVSREDGIHYITISIKENEKNYWFGSNLVEEVVDFVRAYKTLGKDLYFTVEANENEPAIEIHFSVK